MKHKFEYIIFDLDGTLVNTAPDVRLALNYTLLNYGQCELNTNEIYALLGHGVRMLIEKAFARNNVVLQPSEVETAITCYLEYYKAHPVVETSIYPGVIDVLDNLQKDKVKLGICTNKPSATTKVVLKKLNLAHFFLSILSGDEVARPKPDGEHINAVLRELGNKRGPAVMVGDSEVDRLSAENAGIPFIGVRYGYDANKFYHTHMINHFSELPAALEKLSV